MSAITLKFSFTFLMANAVDQLFNWLVKICTLCFVISPNLLPFFPLVAIFFFIIVRSCLHSVVMGTWWEAMHYHDCFSHIWSFLLTLAVFRWIKTPILVMSNLVTRLFSNCVFWVLFQKYYPLSHTDRYFSVLSSSFYYCALLCLNL